MFEILYGFYDISCFLTKSCPDQVVFYERLKHFNSKVWLFRICGHIIGKLISKKIKDIIFRILFKEKKISMHEFGSCLNYHLSYYLRMAGFGICKTKDIYFLLMAGMHLQSKTTTLFHQKIFVWSEGMSVSAMKTVT